MVGGGWWVKGGEGGECRRVRVREKELVFTSSIVTYSEIGTKLLYSITKVM
jgi:hypothetical protein